MSEKGPSLKVSAVSLREIQSIVEEVLLEGELDIDVVEAEAQLATVGLDLATEGLIAVRIDEALEVINEVYLVLVQVTVLGLELGVVEADIGSADNEFD